MRLRLAALAVADEPAAWKDAGFALDDGGRCWLGDVAVTLTPGTGKGVTGWAVDGIDGPVDGLPVLDLRPVEPVEDAVLHPNGTTAIDHVVVTTPDLDRTVAALEMAGLEARRVRDTGGDGRPLRQVFFRLGDPILEVVGPPERSGDGSARFFGLALTVADLDATAVALGPLLGEVKDAVQPGRRIATLRRSAGCTTALAFMSPPPARLMLDHVFTDAIGALRDALENALLERQAFEERFHVDVLLGDMTWETSYGLPGEGFPPRVQADIVLTWPTWAQTAYRNWYNDEPFDEPPEIQVEVSLRIQRLANRPEVEKVLAVLPEISPPVGSETLDRTGPTIEEVYRSDLAGSEFAVEVSYEGAVPLEEGTLKDGSVLDDHFGGMGGWVASTLVRLGDIRFEFLPPETEG